ncbi:MAG: hypothetical protein ACK4S4_06620 [Pyrinomonadaceae bacterium]
MAVNFAKRRVNLDLSPDRSFLPGALVMGLTFLVALFLLLLNSDLAGSYPYAFILPWLAALAVVLVSPSAYLYYRGKFSFDNPIVFATWSYFVPAFVIGGFVLAAGWSEPYFLVLIQDPAVDLPFTIVLIMAGFAGLSAGYFLPVGEKLGAVISRRLPSATHVPSSYLLPGLLLLGLGVANSFIALTLGLFGFQRADEISTYDGLIFLTTLFWLEASFLLWYVLFRQNRWNFTSWLVIMLLVGTAVSKALLAGNRGSLIQIFSTIVLAYILAGRQFKARQAAISGVLLVAMIIAGMIYGTTFRQVKGTEAAQSFDRYAENVFTTIDQLGRSDNTKLLEFGIRNLAERIDVLSTVAVVVSNYEKLAPYEASYGIDNNIWRDTTTFFIPRVIWPDKPVASEPRNYSALYFNFGENSFAITPIGDLVRNFGPWGVPLGMMFLGFILRVVYRALVEGQAHVTWRATLYFMLLTSVSYEAFYGTIIPYMVKFGFTAVIGVLIVNLFATRIKSDA